MSVRNNILNLNCFSNEAQHPLSPCNYTQKTETIQTTVAQSQYGSYVDVPLRFGSVNVKCVAASGLYTEVGVAQCKLG